MLKSGFSKNVVDFIEGIGIKIDDLVEAGMQLCVGVEETKELHDKLHQQILKSLKDLNVVSFIIAGIRLEEDLDIRDRVDEGIQPLIGIGEQSASWNYQHPFGIPNRAPD